MYPNRHPAPGPHQPGQPFKFTVGESCDRIKEEFSFLQAQYHSLKMECEKLAQEKTEMQRHYVMYYEMSYGLNVEMHKQTEIAKRLNAICAQVIPFLSQEHQQQVAAAVERAKQVTMTELNAIIGNPRLPYPTEGLESLHQQMQAHQLPHAHAPPIPMPPHPAGLQPPGLPPTSGSGLLALTSGAGLSQSSHMGGGVKEEKGYFSLFRGRSESSTSTKPRISDFSDSLSTHAPEDRHRSSTSPSDRDKFRNRSRSPELNDNVKKRRTERERERDEKSGESDGEKSDQDLVVDVANEDPTSPLNGERSPRENGPKKNNHKNDAGPSSPRSDASSHASTPSSKHRDKELEKPSTPMSKSATPTSSGNATPGPSSSSGLKAVAKPPLGHYPFMPHATHALPSDLSPSAAYSNSMLHNSISPGALNSAYGRGPMVRTEDMSHFFKALRGRVPIFLPPGSLPNQW